MSCYHPLIAMPSGQVNENGRRKYAILRLTENDTIEDFKKQGCVFIPCGHCIGCRLDYSRSWADRMMLELETEGVGVFLTLTYDNEHLPWINDNVTGEVVPTLCKRDVQLFMKRLRKHFNDFRIRFYAAGEYGEQTNRSHYHIILFGIGLVNIGDCNLFGHNELGQNYYVSDTISKLWSNGNVLVADVSWQTCAYVARYITKKINGELAAEVYGTSGREKEFALMSRKPGLGRDYLLQHPDVLDMQSINISTPDGGLKINIPKYYIKQLDYKGYNSSNVLYNPDKYDKIREDRRKYANDRNLIELSKTDLSLAEYLEVKEMEKYSKLKALKRNKVR